MNKNETINKLIQDSITSLKNGLQSKINDISLNSYSDQFRDLFEISMAIECFEDESAKENIIDYLNNLNDSQFDILLTSSKSFGQKFKDALIYNQDSEETYAYIASNSLDYIIL